MNYGSINTTQAKRLLRLTRRRGEIRSGRHLRVFAIQSADLDFVFIPRRRERNGTKIASTEEEALAFSIQKSVISFGVGATALLPGGAV